MEIKYFSKIQFPHSQKVLIENVGSCCRYRCCHILRINYITFGGEFRYSKLKLVNLTFELICEMDMEARV